MSPYGGMGGYGGYGRNTYGSSGYGDFMSGTDEVGGIYGYGGDGYAAAASTNTGPEPAPSSLGSSSSLAHETSNFDGRGANDGAPGSGAGNQNNWSERFADSPQMQSLPQQPMQPQPSSVTYAGGRHGEAPSAAAQTAGGPPSMGNFQIQTGHDLATGDMGANPMSRGSSRAAPSAGLLSARRSSSAPVNPSVPTSTTTPPPEFVMINPTSSRRNGEDADES